LKKSKEKHFSHSAGKMKRSRNSFSVPAPLTNSKKGPTSVAKKKLAARSQGRLLFRHFDLS
jgi:hypothetical protein